MVKFEIPRGSASQTVSIIDSTSMLANFKITDLATPGLPDVNLFATLPAFSFFVTDSSGKRKVLFDLAFRKDPENYSPFLKRTLVKHKWDCTAEKNVKEVIEEHGVSAHDIEAIIWRFVILRGGSQKVLAV